MKNVFKINKPIHPWKRPIYIDKNCNEVDSGMVSSLTIDFKKDIMYQFIIEANRHSIKNKFPLTESVIGLVVRINSRKECMLPIVCKNIMDALQDVEVVKNDKTITSVLAILNVGTENSVSIGIIPDYRFRDDEDISYAINKSLIQLNINTRPIDKFMCIPIDPSNEMQPNKDNIPNQKAIADEIRIQYTGSIMTGDVSLKIDINTFNTLDDVDNLTINIIQSMVGVVIDNIYQIKFLYMNLIRGMCIDTTIIVEPYP